MVKGKIITVQDIHVFEERIYNIVQDHVDGNYSEGDVLVIGKCCGKITMKANAKENIKVGKSRELYRLGKLVCTGDERKSEPGVEIIPRL